MERLTERLNEYYIKIKGCRTIYGAEERKKAPASSAIARLCAYEDTGLTPEEIMRIISEENEPLTADDLRKMDGEPVWIDGQESGWWIVDTEDERIYFRDMEFYDFSDIGYVATAYREKYRG